MPTPERSADLHLEVLVFPLTDSDRAAFDTLVADPETIVLDGIGDLAIIENSVLPGPFSAVLGDRYVEVDLGNYTTPTDFTEQRIVDLLTELGTLVAGRPGS